MRTCPVYLLLVTVLVAAIARPVRASAKPGARDAAAQSFWSAFRVAIQTKDAVALLGFANFPFIIRWGNDDPNDPKEILDRRDLANAMEQILAMRSESDSEGRTTSEIVENTSSIPASDVASGEFDVANFEFRKIRGNWRWIAVLTTEPSFYPSPDSSEMPRDSSLRKLLIDETANTLKLRRPLTVKHLRTNSKVTYIEARESGKGGRYARAVLQRQPDDKAGHTRWSVTESSFLPAFGGDDEWRKKIATLEKSGIPTSLFSSDVGRQEGDGHAPR